MKMAMFTDTAISVFHILSYIYIYSAIHLVACSAIQTLMHTVRGNIVADVEIKNSD